VNREVTVFLVIVALVGAVGYVVGRAAGKAAKASASRDELELVKGV
jgi:hypothetical protein